MITRFVLRWAFNGVAIYLTTLIIPGIRVADPVVGNTIIAALILGVVNAFIRPVVLLLTLPVNILSLGLFTLVVNALMLYLVRAVFPPFPLSGFWPAVIGALLIAVISTVLSHVLRP
mgnify:FL=1